MASSSRSQLPSWPPTLASAQLPHLTAQATDYALAHGLVYRPAASSSDNGPLSTHVHHAPISLFPSPFPRAAVQQAVQLQGILNELYARVALDDDFLQRVIGGNVAKVDEFQHGLWQVYQEVKKLGQEPIHHLGLFRSDYLLHADPSSSSSQPSIRQVEFNTISSSFGPLCAKVGELHRFLLQQTGYYGVAADVLQQQHLTKNMALSVLVDGLAEGHRVYLAGRNQSQSPQSDPRILIVVQERERNAFDQRWLEYELLQRHGIRAIRRTFTSLISDASIASQDRTLRLRDEASPEDSLEISVVYYRSGYTPIDYTSDAHWKLRLDLERSQAIKCPTVALQLAGAKKVQQVLSEPGVVESFLEGSKRFSSQDVAQLRETWSGLYPLDETSELGREGLRLAQEESQRFVMKPQREGGGNNIYRDEIPKALAAMSKRDQSKSNDEPKEREGYILMELIQPPTGLGNYLIRPPAPASSTTGGAEVVLDPSNSKGSHPEGLTSAECRLSADVVSELGIYGVSLFRRGPDGKTLDEEDYYNEPKAGAFDATKAPYLLRTKGRESDEGGVAVGFSVLDSVLLI